MRYSTTLSTDTNKHIHKQLTFPHPRKFIISECVRSTGNAYSCFPYSSASFRVGITSLQIYTNINTLESPLKAREGYIERLSRWANWKFFLWQLVQSLVWHPQSTLTSSSSGIFSFSYRTHIQYITLMLKQKNMINLFTRKKKDPFHSSM